MTDSSCCSVSTPAKLDMRTFESRCSNRSRRSSLASGGLGWGGAEAIQLRVADSGLVLQMLPVYCGLLVWGGVWLRDERLRYLIPLRAPVG